MSQAPAEIVCPGCGLKMPPSESAVNHSYYNSSPECWSLFTEVIATDYSDAALFGEVHQLAVDAYAVQHAGGPHPDKSVAVHFCGLYMVYAQGLPPDHVIPQLQRFLGRVKAWPHFEPLSTKYPLTVWDVAFADSPEEHAQMVKKWARAVWDAWAPHHEEMGRFLRQHLEPD